MNEIGINEIQGFRIGQAQNLEAATGCTVIISDKGAVTGVDIRGGSPGTRDTDALNPINNREKVHAVLLSGGSSFGLDAAGGVMEFLEERKIGRDTHVTVVPNVCGAILFDLKCGSAIIRPDIAMGHLACENAFSNATFQSGNFGAGTGATVGKIAGLDRAMKGGVGCAAFQYDKLRVGAVIAVNCVGDIFDYRAGNIIAGTRKLDNSGFADSEKLILQHYFEQRDIFSENTAIGCVITNAILTKPQATKLASVAHNGIARVVRPAHSVFDGDTIFAMCGGEVNATLDAVGVLACEAIEKAIINAIMSAKSLDCFPSASDYMVQPNQMR